MKYMGSKKSLLENGLGDIILRSCDRKSRFIDLFSGTGSVATYIAKNAEIEVIAVDLQAYSAIMSDAILSRTAKYKTKAILEVWLYNIIKKLQNSKLWQQIKELEALENKNAQFCLFCT